MNDKLSRSLNRILPKKILYTAQVQINPDEKLTEGYILDRLSNYELTNIKVSTGRRHITTTFRSKRYLTSGEKLTITNMIRVLYFRSIKSVKTTCIEHKPNV